MTQVASHTTRKVLASVIALAGVTVLASNASALSLGVKLACAGDYYKHCSAHSPGSKEVRQCMRSVGSGLSKSCVNALVNAGEVSAAEVTARRAKAQTASR